MKYTIKDHGVWGAYTPEVMPEWTKETPSGYLVSFIRRQTDGKDYYDYVKEGQLSEGSLLATTLHYPSNDEEIVKSVFWDHTKAWPINERLLEIFGVDPNNSSPHNLFTEMVYDPTKKTFSGEPGLKFPVKTLKKDLWLRATDDEADAIEEWVNNLPARQRRLFNETFALDHADSLYEDLTKALTELFNAERANVLLERST